MKRTITIIIALGIILGGFYFLQFNKKDSPIELPADPKQTTIGLSVEGRKIESYTYGTGETHIAFVGGIHGGYEWNSVLLAYKFMDYLKENPEIIPQNLTVTVIPSANPDGVYEVIGKEGLFTTEDIPAGETVALGRFNANEVDLNRNFDCKWKPESTWRSNPVSAGSSAFSEPEAKAIQNFVLENNPVAVIFWHSQSNAVYASECENGVLPETLDIMNAYSKASGYSAVESFDAYEITGDAEGWLASINIPAITVELKTHETIEWEKNLAGIKALFEYYNQKEL
ncbi:hypothetical protein KKC45_01955 [Patescibacteria group bacterium]|nr:hypothetical protein [Patescibacteria group bacterium]